MLPRTWSYQHGNNRWKKYVYKCPFAVGVLRRHIFLQKLLNNIHIRFWPIIEIVWFSQFPPIWKIESIDG